MLTRQLDDGDAELTAAEQAFLDASNNAIGNYDVGELMAYFQRHGGL